MQRIAVSNQKGGVGKTTTAINLAGAMNQRGLDVLFVDLDPQGNATEGLGFTEAYEPADHNLKTVLVDGDPLGDLVIEHDEMDIIPSSVEMFTAEAELIVGMRGRERFADALDEMDTSEYDVMIVDCPPWLGLLTDAAFVACDELVIPALAESTSKRALELLFDQVDTIRDEYQTPIAERAIVANRIDTDGEGRETVEWFHEIFEPGLPVFEIRKRVALKRAWRKGRSIFEYKSDCDMCPVYERLADELDARVTV